MIELINFLSLGVAIGLSAGLTPGPFQTVIIAQTAKYNLKEGIKVSLSPLLTDLPLASFAIIVLSQVDESDFILGIISIVGFLYLSKLALDNLKFTAQETEIGDVKPNSIQKGVMTLFLSPAAYLFWFTIGGPTVIKAYKLGIFALISFLGGIYISFIGSCITVASIVEKSRHFLKSKIYTYIIKLLGGILLFFGLLFLRNGLQLLNLL